ncbi:unnamed protein product [Caenorhabditis nigoni]
MKLSKYPNVIQKEILDNLKCSDLFLLSFVSKHMKNLIKSSQVKRFKNIQRIVYDMQNRELPLISLYSMSIKDIFMLSSVISEDMKNDYFQLNVSGKIIGFK